MSIVHHCAPAPSQQDTDSPGGIYAGVITHPTTGEPSVYIGKTNRFLKRWSDHERELAAGTHHSWRFQAAYDRFTELAGEPPVIDWQEIEQVPLGQPRLLQAREDYWLAATLADYPRACVLNVATAVTHRPVAMQPQRSMFLGVAWNHDQTAWVARVWTGWKYRILGAFDDELDAALAYDAHLDAEGLSKPRNFPRPGEEATAEQKAAIEAYYDRTGGD